jgi:tetratricopeptide (TPR) repeat protein
MASWSLPSASAQSSDDERARGHFLAGSSYFKAEDYAAAAREFQEAFALSGRPEMLLNVSSSHHKAGDIDAAIVALETLLGRYPKTSLREEAEARLAELRAERESKADVGPRDEPQVEAPKPPTPEPAVTPAQPEDAQAEPKGGGIAVGLPTWIVGGVAVALGAAALGTGIVAHGKYKDCEGGRCSQSEIDSGKTLAIVSTAATFTAVAAVGAAVTMFMLDVGVSDDREVALTPVLSPRAAGLVAEMSF